MVCPESPYGVCTTSSSPSPAPSASARSSSHVAARPITFGTLGTPASSASRVVSIFESRRWRSAAAGKATSRPTSAHSASVSSSNIRNAARPPEPRPLIQSTTSLCPSRWLQISSMDSNATGARSRGTKTLGWCPSKESNQLT